MLSIIRTPPAAEKFRPFQEDAAEAFAAPMDARLHRPDIRAGDTGNLLVVVAMDIRKHDRLALLELEAHQRGLDSFADRYPFEVFRCPL